MKIIQISSVRDPKYIRNKHILDIQTYGLGDDNKVYAWNVVTETWELNSIKTNN